MYRQIIIQEYWIKSDKVAAEIQEFAKIFGIISNSKNILQSGQ